MKPCIEMHRRSCPGPSDHSRWSSRSPAICDDFPKAPVGFAEARHDLATKGGKMGKDGETWEREAKVHLRNVGVQWD